LTGFDSLAVDDTEDNGFFLGAKDSWAGDWLEWRDPHDVLEILNGLSEADGGRHEPYSTLDQDQESQKCEEFVQARG
jgi:hypothetical protein